MSPHGPLATTSPSSVWVEAIETVGLQHNVMESMEGESFPGWGWGRMTTVVAKARTSFSLRWVLGGFYWYHHVKSAHFPDYFLASDTTVSHITPIKSNLNWSKKVIIIANPKHYVYLLDLCWRFLRILKITCKALCPVLDSSSDWLFGR